MIQPAIATSAVKATENIESLNSKLTACLGLYESHNRELFEAAVYAVESPGHRWRPTLFLAIYDKLSETKHEGLLTVACAIEYIHTASIILDDLPAMDDGTLRRGKKPCHLQFGQARAILAALSLCDLAQQLIHDFQLKHGSGLRLDLETELVSTKREMMKGQILDLECNDLTEEQIIEKYRLKSGALYAFTASAPAHLLGLNELAGHLSYFGNCLGIAYQISDDIHDQADSIEVLGKNVRKDDNKSTIPAMVGLKKAAEMRDFYKLRAINELSNISSSVDDLVELVEQICV